MHSSEQLDSLRHCPPARALVCDIRLDCLGYATFFVNHSFRLQDPFEVVIEECHLGAVPGKKHGSRSAVANLPWRLPCEHMVQLTTIQAFGVRKAFRQEICVPHLTFETRRLKR